MEKVLNEQVVRQAIRDALAQGKSPMEVLEAAEQAQCYEEISPEQELMQSQEELLKCLK